MAIFDARMRGLISEANVQCNHETITQETYEDGDSRFFCEKCDTEMESKGEGFEVRR
jgi:hypothetical protein